MNLKDMYQKNQKLSDLRQRLAASIKDNKPDELSDAFLRCARPSATSMRRSTRPS